MHPNEQLLRDGYEAFNRGDMAAVTEGWSDDIVWHVRGSLPFQRDRTGAEDIVAFLGEFIGLTGGTFRIEVKKVFADDEDGVVLCQQSASVAGRDLDALVAHVYRLRDGKICEGWFLIDDAVEADKALADAYARAAA